MNMKIRRAVIETGVPIPPPRAAQASTRWPFDQMKVGDSFFVPIPPDENRVAVRNRFSGCLSWQRAKHGRLFITRKTEGGFRVWRTS